MTYSLGVGRWDSCHESVSGTKSRAAVGAASTYTVSLTSVVLIFHEDPKHIKGLNLEVFCVRKTLGDKVRRGRPQEMTSSQRPTPGSEEVYVGTVPYP